MNSFFARRYVITGIFIALFLVLLIKLFSMQIMDDKYLLASKSNVVRRYIVYPARGPILDRNGKILVQNEPVYDITVIPREVKPFDTVLFCKLLGIDKAEFDKKFNKAQKYSPYLPSVFEKQIPLNIYAAFQERLPEFRGFDVLPRTIRTYPDSIAAQFLGYIGEVTDRDIEKSGGFYRPGDYVGRTGVERAYEDVLRGQRGVQNWMVDSRNVRKGHFANGAFDTVAVAGERLISSLDSRIQKLGEQLMKNKVGSIVAIEPSTGEILAFVSSPTYDPNIMVGRDKGSLIAKMWQDPYSPFLIRPIQAYYSPGSSFKPLDALIALQEGIITPQTTYFCPHYYQAGNHRVACEHFDGVTDLRKGIAMSCNTYFCNVFDRLMNANGPKNTSTTYAAWRQRVNNFGFGVKLDVDMPNERRGFVPKPLFYDNRFGKNHWRSSTIISLAIGQGELNATPLQMANIECTIANRGFYFKPHLIKAIGDKNVIKKEFLEKHYVGIDSMYFQPVIEGMQDVVERGTAADSRIPGIIMCGKTGTVQNPHGKNHSVFVGFAPRDNPKIAIAVVVENAGYGASWAAPIASFMMEKYLKDSITRRPSGIDVERYIHANLMPPTPAQIKAMRARQDSLKRIQDSLRRYHRDTLPRPSQIIRSTSHKNKKDTSNRVYATALINRREDEK